METTNSAKYWVIVASKDHVSVGVSGGFCQANHGKEAPLKRMKPADWVIFYSPKEKFGNVEKYQKFTAIGKIKDDLIYQVKMREDFSPFRRRVEFLPSTEAPIEPLIPKLSFIKNKKSWGYVFRFGLIQISRKDFSIIESKMLKK